MEELEIRLHIWNELKTYLDVQDIDKAAEAFVTVLIENGVDPDDIMDYTLDEHIKMALGEFIEINDEEFDDEDSEEYET